MKKILLSVALSLSATAALAGGGGSVAIDDFSASTRTRAEVRAELAVAREQGLLADHGERAEAPAMDAASTLSRATVRMQAREAAAMRKASRSIDPYAGA
jgi:hypothetical protein